MPMEAYDFESPHTVGEIKALLAPLFNTTAEDVDTYIVIYAGKPQHSEMLTDTHEVKLGIVSSDPHPECKIALLAEVIKLITGDIAEGSNA